MIDTYWHIGKRIVDEEQHGQKRADYGSQLIDFLSNQLSKDYGDSYSPRYLRSFRKFYTIFPDYDIWKSRFPNLTWTHIFRALRVSDDAAIRWYLSEASAQMWSVRTLDRNISTQYFERHLSQPQYQLKRQHLFQPTKPKSSRTRLSPSSLDLRETRDFRNPIWRTPLFLICRTSLWNLARALLL